MIALLDLGKIAIEGSDSWTSPTPYSSEARPAAILAASVHAGAAAQPPVRDDLTPGDLKRVTAITAPARDFSKAETFETMQAGAATTGKMINADIFSQPSANMDFERRRVPVGNGLFRKDWVSAPSSTQASDGLGPLFNARSCRPVTPDGRGSVPGFDPLERPDAVALLRRPFRKGRTVAIRGWGRMKSPPCPNPSTACSCRTSPWPAGRRAHGDRLHADGRAAQWRRDRHADEARLPHREPGLRPDARRHADLAPPAPPMIGLGLLESIHEADILANVGADKRDGIVGKANW